MIAFFSTSIGRWIVGALLSVLALVGVYFVADHRGYQRAATAYTAQIEQMKTDAATARANEIERQDAANNAAKQAEAARITQMQADANALQTQIEELQREAHQDPDAGKPALGASGVQRINKVR
jgi:ABC-type transport system involved in cytochrome bd biosynthesis fused ATPase/permease subunit